MARDGKKKFVLMLHNINNPIDREWLVFWAKPGEEEEASKGLKYEENRFNRGPIYTAAEFHKKMGKGLI